MFYGKILAFGISLSAMAYFEFNGVKNLRPKHSSVQNVLQLSSYLQAQSHLVRAHLIYSGEPQAQEAFQVRLNELVLKTKLLSSYDYHLHQEMEQKIRQLEGYAQELSLHSRDIAFRLESIERLSGEIYQGVRSLKPGQTLLTRDDEIYPTPVPNP